MLCGPGGDLLSQVLRHSTIGARAFDGRVRDGIGSDRSAKATRPAKGKVMKQTGRLAPLWVFMDRAILRSPHDLRLKGLQPFKIMLCRQPLQAALDGR